jgi:thiamine biosynthesis protein ThiS
MTITLNGEKKQMPDGITVLGLLEFLKIQRQRVAVELNLEIVKKDVYSTTPVKEGDCLEVVSFMAGGCAGTMQVNRLQVFRWLGGHADLTDYRLNT